MNATQSSPPILALEHVSKTFSTSRGRLHRRESDGLQAVTDVSLAVEAGQTLGLVGESGCGKSTLARCIARLHTVTSGRVLFDGVDLAQLSQSELRKVRRHLQMVFQDPYASLNPKRRVDAIVGDPMRVHGLGDDAAIARRVGELLELVGLSPDHGKRYPHEFSGGQRQRIGIARALAVDPRLVIADEPVSALDVSVQAQVLNLLADLQDELGLTYVVIAHDLGVVRHVSDRIAVMYLGRIVEVADAEDLYAAPAHPYTEALLSAVPIPDPDRSDKRNQIVLEGDVPDPSAPPPGCPFAPRCRHATDVCRTTMPPLERQRAGHLVACHHPRPIPAAPPAVAA